MNIACESLYQFEPSLPENPHAKIKTGISSIDELNLERLVAKAIYPLTGLNWSLQEALEISDLYRVFLFLCFQYPEKTIVPPRDVDEFWHLHILDTRNYKIDCEKIFGSFLHHFPYSGLDRSSEIEKLEFNAIQDTLELVKKHFPKLVGEI